MFYTVLGYLIAFISLTTFLLTTKFSSTSVAYIGF